MSTLLLSASTRQAILWDKHDSDTRYLARLISAKLCELENDIANVQVSLMGRGAGQHMLRSSHALITILSFSSAPTEALV